MTAPRLARHGPIRQIAWVTDDLDRSIAHWRTIMGVGPWTVYRNVVLHGVLRGAPATVRIDVGLSYQHDMQIELIAPHGDGPSPYHHADGRVKSGIHHIAWLVADIVSATNDAVATGLQRVFRADDAGGATRVAYLAQPADPSLLIELIEATPMIRDAFAQGVAAAGDETGRDAVTVIDLGA